MIKKLLLLLTIFLVGLIGVLGARALYIHQIAASFVPQKVSYQIEPPSQATSGEIKQLEGDVKKFSRTSIEFEPTKEGEKVLLGERIATGEDGKVVVEFKDLAKVTFSSKSESAFIETIPERFSIRQAEGVITYESTEKPISIRSMHMILSLTGSAIVNVDKDNGQITIDILSGTAEVGMVDNDTKTHKWDLKIGQRIFIDDETRSVRITGK